MKVKRKTKWRELQSENNYKVKRINEDNYKGKRETKWWEKQSEKKNNAKRINKKNYKVKRKTKWWEKKGNKGSEIVCIPQVINGAIFKSS